MTTTPVPRPDYEAHLRATHALLPDVAHDPRDILGAELCAHLGSAREMCEAHRRVDGSGQPGVGSCGRLRVVLHLGRAVTAVDEPLMAQAGFQGARNGDRHRRYG